MASISTSPLYRHAGTRGEVVMEHFGISGAYDGEIDLNSMISNADSALYKSKNDERNRVTVWERDGRE